MAITHPCGNNSSLQRKLSHFMTQKYQTRCLQKKLLPNDLNPLSDRLLAISFPRRLGVYPGHPVFQMLNNLVKLIGIAPLHALNAGDTRDIS
jgi:hypothetical protein